MTNFHYQAKIQRITNKNRNYPSITFAAPVKLNGSVGNVVVAVKVMGKTRYNAHRVLMPDGTEFVLGNEKNIEPQSARVTNNKEGQRSAKGSMFNNKVTQNNPIVNTNSTQEIESYSIRPDSRLFLTSELAKHAEQAYIKYDSMMLNDDGSTVSEDLESEVGIYACHWRQRDCSLVYNLRRSRTLRKLVNINGQK